LESYVRPEDIHFDYRNITSIEKIEGLYEQASSRTEWGQHSYHNAVDSDPSTCWDTLKGKIKNWLCEKLNNACFSTKKGRLFWFNAGRILKCQYIITVYNKRIQ
jgi:hypothetical protein